MQERIEHDSLGEVRLPADALYGAQTARAVQNFPISGLRASSWLIRAVAMVKLAAARANAQLGMLPSDKAEAIAEAASEVIRGEHDEHFVVDAFQAGAGVSFHMNANEVLANLANRRMGVAPGSYTFVHPNDHVNFGQSTNDVFPSAMRLSALLALQPMFAVLTSLEEAFAQKGREFDGIVKAGRTHMQDAVPIRLGQEFAAYAAAVTHAAETIEGAAATLQEIGLGGSAVGTGINTHPEYRQLAVAELSRISGLPLRPAADLRFAMQSCAPVATLSGALRVLALEIIRISNDLRLLSSGPNTGLHEIDLPALQPGSSIMPGKVNPVLPELVAMVGFQVVGNDAAIAMAVQAGQLELNVMMPVMAHNLLQSITILTNALRELDLRCVRGITANEERCEHYARSTVALATGLNPYLGYERAAKIAQESVRTGESILAVAQRHGGLDGQSLEELLDPARMTEPRMPAGVRAGDAAGPPRT